MNANKPVIPREVADAIESFRESAYTNYNILRYSVYKDPTTNRARAIRAYADEHGLDTLLAALVNGYEVEKSAEEIAYDKLREYFTFWNGYAQRGHNYAVAVHDVTLHVLDTLGIKISGVNAPEEDVK